MSSMLIRAYGPPCVLLVVAFAILFSAPEVRSGSYAAPIINLLPWVSLIPFAMGSWLLAAASFRLWRYERGEGPMCNKCGGPLGGEKVGKRGRGDYRTCMQCGTNVNERFYR